MFREPAVAGSFYPLNAVELKKSVENGFLGEFGIGKIPKLFKSFKGKDYPFNIFVPHAGYAYSSFFASYSYFKLAEEGFPETFIIICPNHTGHGTEISIFNEGYWRTPLGDVEVDSEFSNTILSFSDYGSSDFKSHKLEHSIEVQLPFLQYFSNDFKIVPVSMGLQDFKRADDLARAIVKAGQKLDKSYSIIASTDLSHFNSQELANELDKMVLKDIENMDEKQLLKDVFNRNISMCGFAPVVTTIIASKLTCKNNCDILAYGTSGDITGDFSSVVGYGSGIFR
jgi:AmmeMemoRadiSam system protein B